MPRRARHRLRAGQHLRRRRRVQRAPFVALPVVARRTSARRPYPTSPPTCWWRRQRGGRAGLCQGDSGGPYVVPNGPGRLHARGCGELRPGARRRTCLACASRVALPRLDQLEGRRHVESAEPAVTTPMASGTLINKPVGARSSGASRATRTERSRATSSSRRSRSAVPHLHTDRRRRQTDPAAVGCASRARSRRSARRRSAWRRATGRSFRAKSSCRVVLPAARDVGVCRPRGFGRGRRSRTRRTRPCRRRGRAARRRRPTASER